ncbi:MAG: Flavin reductase like domain protein [Firmicutes bacterium ADurb.Bin182]|nr:MAG: Flavin reductase like domain protein [Firmicutes bacterium ADurb.Bin182]
MDFEKFIGAAAEQVKHGAFLVTGQEANPMTIGWCLWGRVWERPVCTVFVRKSRYSHELIEGGKFTVSVPAPGTFKKELAFCGSRSGRDTDKLKDMGMARLKLSDEGIDGIEGCAVHFECKVLFKCEMGLKNLNSKIRDRFYGPDETVPGKDPHTIYFGEIVAVHSGQ